MASEDVQPNSVKRRKRKRMQSERKLVVGSRVEVRSLEDGLLGSWHSGTVIACGAQKRKVKYDDCVADDGSKEIEEVVPVPPAVDGLDSGNCASCTSYRGRIRPLPPQIAKDPGELLYGMCVDVHHADAWWEGVIFDSSTVAKERNIFFPDLGDQLVADINEIRITRDWTEDDGSWVRRGFWPFTKVIREFEEELSLPISVKQIWYDLRQMEGFRNIEWTCSDEALWQKMVFKTVLGNLKIALSCIAPPHVSEGESARELNAELEFHEPPQGFNVVPATDVSNCLSILPVAEPVVACRNVSNTNSEINPPRSVNAVDNQVVRLSKAIVDAEVVPVRVNLEDVSDDETPCPKSGEWAPADLDLEPACCPDAFETYLANHLGSARTVLKKHLAYLGWKTESRFSGGTMRFRYMSPEGVYYLSLLQVCRAQSGRTEDATKESLVTSSRGSRFSSLSPYEDSHFCKTPVTSASSEATMGDVCDRAPAHCPQAVLDYCRLDMEQCASRVGKELRSIVKRELVAIGWTQQYRQKERKLEVIYISPWGRHYFSLRSACQACIEDSRSQESMEVKFPSNEKALVVLQTDKAESDRNLRSIQTEPTRPMRLRIKLAGAFLKSNDEPGTSQSQLSRSVRSSNRVQKTASRPFRHNPKTILSWLMDNDALLPRTKVHCCRDNRSSSLREGRVHREGIRCSCCNDLLTLSGFVSHSKGKSCSPPAALIFMEDGRSLLDCQVQILKNRSHLMEAPSERTCTEESHDNDYLCSICHYGGDLILCDRCPSSFHNTCLGLMDVPEGDWFCPSCCCGICGEGKLTEERGNSTDISIINCDQCERKYHTACLRKERAVEVADHQRGNWYCSKKCEQIHGALLEIEGKKISLGVDNLVMTLLKPVDYNRHVDVCQMMYAAENYAKLNIALDVMHECFEPVKEPFSCRDLIEDVIFNRRSDLKRLDFRGFYTVLLEKNDELISVATIRIHGEKVAELPLVATRFHFRRQGMCHALMNGLEKKLKELGVERIALPAVPSALNTWTGSFGFTEMTESERLHFVNHTFLNFQDTTMCQKQLLDIPSVESTIPNGKLLAKIDDHLEGCHTELEDSSTVSEDLQGKAMEGKEIVEQITIAEVKDADGTPGSVHEVSEVHEPLQPHSKQSLSEQLREPSIMDINSEEKCSREISSEVFKYYHRRRMC